MRKIKNELRELKTLLLFEILEFHKTKRLSKRIDTLDAEVDKQLERLSNYKKETYELKQQIKKHQEEQG